MSGRALVAMGQPVVDLAREHFVVRSLGKFPEIRMGHGDYVTK
jgi:hypothetical protein